MTVINTHDLILPSNPRDIEKLTSLMKEAANVLQIIDDKKSYLKDMKAEIKDEHGAEFVKQFNKCVTAYHKNNYDEKIVDSSNFELMYETLADT